MLGAPGRPGGLGPRPAGGTITTGGTESNLVGLLLGRERGSVGPASTHRARRCTAGALRMFGSEVAHFSLQRSAGVLGVGERP